MTIPCSYCIYNFNLFSLYMSNVFSIIKYYSSFPKSYKYNIFS